MITAAILWAVGASILGVAAAYGWAVALHLRAEALHDLRQAKKETHWLKSELFLANLAEQDRKAKLISAGSAGGRATARKRRETCLSKAAQLRREMGA